MSLTDRRWVKQAIVGLLTLPLSLVPFGLYFSRTDEGRLVWAKAETRVAPPRVTPPSRSEVAWARDNAPEYSGRVALLVYHGIGMGSDAEGGAEYTISPERFAEQLVTLRAAGMNAVTAREVALAFAGKAELPPNAFMISFDDGRTDAMLYADPILRDLELRATMFVITQAAASTGIYYVDWPGLKGYAATGRWDLQSHTADAHREHETSDGRSLPALTSLRPDESPATYRRRIAADLRQASGTIETEIGVPPLAFAYPFGAYGGQYDDRQNHEGVSRAVRDAVGANHVLAFNQDDQSTWTLASCSDNPSALRRLSVGDWSGRDLLLRITAASATSGPGLGCEAAKHMGRTDGVYEGLPSYVRERVDRVAKMRGRTPQPPRTRVRDATPAAFAATGDAVGGCQVTYVGCVGYPAPEGTATQSILDLERFLGPILIPTSRPDAGTAGRLQPVLAPIPGGPAPAFRAPGFAQQQQPAAPPPSSGGSQAAAPPPSSGGSQAAAPPPSSSGAGTPQNQNRPAPAPQSSGGSSGSSASTTQQPSGSSSTQSGPGQSAQAPGQNRAGPEPNQSGAGGGPPAGSGTTAGGGSSAGGTPPAHSNGGGRPG